MPVVYVMVVPEIATDIEVTTARVGGQNKVVTIQEFSNSGLKVKHLNSLKSVATADTIFKYESGIVSGTYKKYTQDVITTLVDGKQVVAEKTALKLIGSGVNNPPEFLYVKEGQFDNNVYVTLSYE